MQLTIETVKEYVVARVSDNTNAFGHYGHVLLAEDGDAYQLCVGHLHKKNPGDKVSAVVSVFPGGGTRVSFRLPNECPEHLGTAPADVVAEAWGRPVPATAKTKAAKGRPARAPKLSDSVPATRGQKAGGYVTAENLSGAWK